MLPARPTERVVIYAVDTIDLERMEYEESLDPRITYAKVVDATAINPDDALQNRLLEQGLLVPGNTLVQNPYRPHEYATISGAEEKFALDKFFIFSLLCQTLGAEAVQIQAIEENTSERSVTVNVGGKNVTGAQGEVSGLSAAGQKILAQKDLLDTFQGGEPDVEGARDLLRNLRLDGDPILRSLVESRARLGNPHKTRRISVDLSEETTRIMAMAGRVRTPAFFKLEADVSSIASSSVRLRVVYLVTFP